MTKATFLIALGLSVLGAPALAQHGHQGGYAPVVGATDPCLLGTHVQPGTCVGPVRVAPIVISQGGVHAQPTQLQPIHQGHAVYSNQPIHVHQPAYAPQAVAYAQPAPHYQPPAQVSSCVQGYNGPSVPCNGVWVPVPGYAPAPVMMQPTPQYIPAPYMPGPIAYAPQPQQVGNIPVSFFTGGITYGAGFPTDTTYSYGGGGFGYSSGGGTRFSGVRERSPTPLVAPPRRQRHAPPPAHHHGCC